MGQSKCRLPPMHCFTTLQLTVPLIKNTKLGSGQPPMAQHASTFILLKGFQVLNQCLFVFLCVRFEATGFFPPKLSFKKIVEYSSWPRKPGRTYLTRRWGPGRSRCLMPWWSPRLARADGVATWLCFHVRLWAQYQRRWLGGAKTQRGHWKKTWSNQSRIF